MQREYPFGAQVFDEGVHFRVWASQHSRVELLLNGKSYPCEPEEDGCFSLFVKEAKPGDDYFYLLDGNIKLPDPVSFYQPEGVFGPSRVFDPRNYPWRDTNWKSPSSLKGEVIYEMHIGTFTREGTWSAAAEKLPFLAEMGISLIEMMPIAEFVGDFGWGYDGLFLFAPYTKYGKPADLMAFIDAAHHLGIGVILDVVYNHFGPGLDLHKQFSRSYFAKQDTEWGSAINFDGEESGLVRQFFISNACFFLQHYHFDGLRFDATQDIHDNSTKHFLQELAETLKIKWPDKHFVLTAENESQNSALISDYGLDALWNDDFHHSAQVALIGKRDGYFSDYQGLPQEILSTIKNGFLYQGQYYPWQKKNRGRPALDLTYENFIIFLENHDQVANLLMGKRLSTLSQPTFFRAITALFLLAPQVPLIFQGQEIGSKSPFHFFAAIDSGLNKKIKEGRESFLQQFPTFLTHEPDDFADPSSAETFKQCKLKWEEIDEKVVFFFKTLLNLRKTDNVFSDVVKLDGAVIENRILLLRYFGKEEDRLVLCNFGAEYKITSLAEPLYAPRLGKKWNLLLASEDTRFGGLGYLSIENDHNWVMPAYTTYLFNEGIL